MDLKKIQIHHFRNFDNTTIDFQKNFNPDKGKQLNQLVQFWKDSFASIESTTLLKVVAKQANDNLKAIGLEVLEEFRYPDIGDDEYFEPIY